MGDASELSSAAKVAEDAGEVARKDDQATQRLSSVVNDGSDRELPARHSAALRQSGDGTAQWTEAQHAILLLQTRRRGAQSMSTRRFQASRLHPQFLPRCRTGASQIRYVRFALRQSGSDGLGKLGWNVPYDFNETDFRISMTLIATYLSKSATGEREAIPWKTLKYLIGEAMYGGRVSDNDDRRVLRTYLDEYIGDFIFDEFGRFWLYHHHGVKTTLPRETNGDVTYYRSIVEAFPDVQSPTVFGLSANADISYHTDRTRQLWTDLVRLQTQSSGGGAAGGGPSREMLVQKIVDDLRERIPEPFDVQKIKKGISQPEPLQLVLHQELDHWNRLVRFMTASLSELDKALSGEVGFSSDLEALADALYNGQLPPSWARLAPQTEKRLGHWMEGFVERHRQYRLWTETGTPTVLWLSGLHVPETFLAALIQTACRREGWPLDKATLSTDVTNITDPDAIISPPEMGCYVRGLYLEGAGWDLDGRRLTKQKPKETLTPMPIIRLLPEASRESIDRGVYRAPVYVTQRRRDAMGKGHVFDADLRSDEHASHWTLQGVALVLNIA